MIDEDPRHPVRFLYKCRLCGAAFGDLTMYLTRGEQRFYLKQLAEKGAIDARIIGAFPPTQFSVHTCDDDGRRVGVADLVGLEAQQ